MNEPKTSFKETSWVPLLPDGLSQFLLGVYFIFSQWNPNDSVSVARGDSIYLILLGVLLGLFTALDRILTKQEHRVSLNWKMLVTVFFLWLMFATLQTAGKGDFRIATLGFWQSVSLLGVVSCFYSQAMKPRRLESLLRWIVGTVAGTVFLALYQYLFSFPAMREAYLANPAGFMEDRGFSKNSGFALGSAEALQWENRLLSTEPVGPFALTNSLAGFVGPWFVIIIALLAWVLIPSTSQQTKNAMNSREWMRKLPSFFLTLWILAIGSGAVLMLTKSRTAWLAFFVTSLVLFLGRDSLGGRSLSHLHRYRTALAPILLLIGVIGGIFLWRDPAIVQEAGKSFSYRIQYWSGASDMVETSPLFGVGPLNFQNVYPQFKEITASETPADPHNMWAELATWGGLPLLVLGLIAAGGVVQLFGINLATESSKVPEEAADSSGDQPTPRTSLLLTDFGAAFGLVCIVAFSFLAPNVESMISSLVFAGSAFYVALTLSASAWMTFVRENRAKIGLVLCTFMAIHLFFSGGWMQPGCMNTLLVGSALAFISTHKRPAKSDDLHEWSPAIPTVLWSGLLVAFVFSVYLPETKLASWQLDNQQGVFDSYDAEQWAQMLTVHKHSSELANSIAAKAKQKAMQSNLGNEARDKWLNLFLEASSEITKRSPKAWGGYSSVGINALSLAEQSFNADQQSTLRELARSSFDQARLLNPTSITAQLQSAVVDVWVNRQDEAKLKLEQIELIENQTPHTDKKLAASTVHVYSGLLQAISNLPIDKPEEAPVLDIPSKLVKGEPVFYQLRRILGPGGNSQTNMTSTLLR